MTNNGDSKAWIHLHPEDHCVVALRKLGKGESIHLSNSQSVTMKKDIPPGHKVAIAARKSGEPVFKYGWSIGIATGEVSPGDHLHDHNLKCHHELDYQGLATETPAPPEKLQGKTFQGFLRPSGRVGTRNYIAVISTVNCSAGVSKAVARHFDQETLREFPNVDGVIAFTHDSGCGMAA